MSRLVAVIVVLTAALVAVSSLPASAQDPGSSLPTVCETHPNVWRADRRAEWFDARRAEGRTQFIVTANQTASVVCAW